jgi:hypothetical protein
VVETGGLENRCTGNRTGGSNPSPSATQSELQRNCDRSMPKYANNARISRLLRDKPDCRERTARQQRRSLSRFFSGWHMCSPVSTRTLGECDAITSCGFSHSELTFVSPLGIEFGASHKLVPAHVRIKAVISELNTPFIRLYLTSHLFGQVDQLNLTRLWSPSSRRKSGNS